jgi:2-polyprenyl-3-methyl-5-hydroxy-6-metoxy-1,4-benzoquinol methylase
LLIEGLPSDDWAMSGTSPRYVLKPDPHSSHSVILRWLGDGRGRRLLDVGAADGLLSRQLAGRGWRVTAIEGDPVLAQAAGRYCERVITLNLDREIPVGEGPFDVIVYGDVLEHLIDPLRVLVELDRSLAPAGFVVISVPNIAHLWIRLLLLVGRFDYLDRGILDQSHLRFFTERSLRAMLADAGLSIERFTATPAPLYQILPVSWHRGWVNATHAINAAIARKMRRLLGYQFIVLAHPKDNAERPGVS